MSIKKILICVLCFVLLFCSSCAKDDGGLRLKYEVTEYFDGEKVSEYELIYAYRGETAFISRNGEEYLFVPEEQTYRIYKKDESGEFVPTENVFSHSAKELFLNEYIGVIEVFSGEFAGEEEVCSTPCEVYREEKRESTGKKVTTSYVDKNTGLCLKRTIDVSVIKKTGTEFVCQKISHYSDLPEINK